MRLFDEIEDIVVPVVHLDDAPTTGESLGEACLRHELRQPHKIVGGGREGEGPSDAVTPTELRLVLPCNGLDPAECLLDALADAQDDAIAAMARRAPVDGRAATMFCATWGVTLSTANL